MSVEIKFSQQFSAPLAAFTSCSFSIIDCFFYLFSFSSGSAAVTLSSSLYNGSFTRCGFYNITNTKSVTSTSSCIYSNSAKHMKCIFCCFSYGYSQGSAHFGFHSNAGTVVYSDMNYSSEYGSGMRKNEQPYSSWIGGTTSLLIRNFNVSRCVSVYRGAIYILSPFSNNDPIKFVQCSDCSAQGIVALISVANPSMSNCNFINCIAKSYSIYSVSSSSELSIIQTLFVGKNSVSFANTNSLVLHLVDCIFTVPEQYLSATGVTMIDCIYNQSDYTPSSFDSFDSDLCWRLGYTHQIKRPDGKAFMIYIMLFQ